MGFAQFLNENRILKFQSKGAPEHHFLFEVNTSKSTSSKLNRRITAETSNFFVQTFLHLTDKLPWAPEAEINRQTRSVYLPLQRLRKIHVQLEEVSLSLCAAAAVLEPQ